MGGYLAYTDYKNSEIEWLEKIPASWIASRLKHVTTQIIDGAHFTPTYVSEGTPFLRVTDIVQAAGDRINLNNAKFIPEEEHLALSQRCKPSEGDLLYSKNGTIGVPRVIDWDFEFSIFVSLCLIKINRDKIDSAFLYYSLLGKLTQTQIQLGAKSNTVTNLHLDKIKEFWVCLPPKDEQQTIATFLDYKTAQIDALIAKKEALLKKLAEKRTALISQAVTKGLDPTVEMKDSGIEWLGDIPAHWKVKRLKFISPEQSVGVVINPSSHFDDEGSIPFIYGSNIREYSIDASSARRINTESNRVLSKSRLKAGDLLVVRVGAPGVTAVVPPELDDCNCASVMFVRQHETFDSEWLCHAFNAKLGRFQVELVQYGAAQKQFNIEHAVNFAFPVPPIEEQIVMVKSIASKLAPIQATGKKLILAIQRLKEYRTALITNAVTGKIDVRDIQLPQSTLAEATP